MALLDPHHHAGAGTRQGALGDFLESSRAAREIARALVARRHELGLSQTTVGSRMGTSQSAVARIESGAGVTFATLQRYARAVESELAWTVVPADPDRTVDDDLDADTTDDRPALRRRLR